MKNTCSYLKKIEVVLCVRDSKGITILKILKKYAFKNSLFLITCLKITHFNPSLEVTGYKYFMFIII